MRKIISSGVVKCESKLELHRKFDTEFIRHKSMGRARSGSLNDDLKAWVKESGEYEGIKSEDSDG